MSSRSKVDPVAQAMQELEEHLVTPTDLEVRVLERVTNSATAQAMQAIEEQLAVPADLEDRIFGSASRKTDSLRRAEEALIKYMTISRLSFRQGRSSDPRPNDAVLRSGIGHGDQSSAAIRAPLTSVSVSSELQNTKTAPPPVPGDDGMCSTLTLISPDFLALQLAARNHDEKRATIAPSLDQSNKVYADTVHRCGRFETRTLLGPGSLGTIYSAFDLTSKQQIALELFPSTLMNRLEIRQRFLREVTSASTVKHPNIAAIFDVGEADGLVFIAREHVEGRSLRSMIDTVGGPLPEVEVVQIGRQLARGLAAAHRLGLAHHDVKPEKIIIDEQGTVKLINLGPVTLDDAEVESGGSTSNDLRSVAEPRPATSRYRSVEPVGGFPQDARSDVFAFGVVLFEMLAHKKPFRGETTADMRAAALHEEPPSLQLLRDGAGEQLARIVSRCLEKDPTKRYADASALLVDLDDRALNPTSTSRRLPRRSQLLWLSSSVVATAVALGFLYKAPPHPVLPSRPVLSSSPSAPTISVNSPPKMSGAITVPPATAKSMQSANAVGATPPASSSRKQPAQPMGSSPFPSSDSFTRH